MRQHGVAVAAPIGHELSGLGNAAFGKALWRHHAHGALGHLRCLRIRAHQRFLQDHF